MTFSKEDLQTHYLEQLSPAVFASVNQIIMTADQALLNLSQDASDNHSQNSYYEAAQSLRIGRNHITKCFDANLFGKPFPEHIDVEDEHIKSLRDLAGLQPEGWKANASLAAGIADYQSRLAEIAPDAPNLLEPGYFTENFLKALAEVELDIHTKILVLRTFESQLYSRLDKFIRLMNQLLADKGILPDLETAPSDVVDSMNAIVAGGSSSQANAAVEFLDAALSDFQALIYEGLEERLEPVKASEWVDVPAIDLIQELQGEGLIPGELDPAQKLESEKITLVKGIFDYILQDRSIPLIARAVISEMQVTFSRIALVQEDFLQNNQHPAKRLLSEITQLASHWECKKEDLASDEFYKKLCGAVTNFVEAERIDQLNIQDMIFEFLVYAEAQRQRDALSSQRLIDGEISASGAETARKEVEQLINEKIGDDELPGSVLRFLNEGWSNVLYLCAVKHGKDSNIWKSSVYVLDEIIYTTRSAEPFATRTELLVRLPELLKTIREGLSSIDMSPVLINQMFSDLEAEHKRIIGRIENPEIDDDSLNDCREKARAKVIEFRLRASDAAEEVEKTSGQHSEEPEDKEVAEEVASAEVSESPDQQALDILATIGQGSSLLWHKDGEKVRCRVAAIIKHTQKYILTDRSGAKLADFVEADLVAKLASGEIENLDSEPMFERALESVIGGMRNR